MSISSLNEDMNIVQSLIIPGIDTDMDIIQKLDDEPNDVGGLTAQELKAEFDKAGNIVKDYINETLLPSISDTVVEEEQRAQAEAQRQANEIARQQAEEQRANETSGIVAQATAQAQQAQQSAGAAAQSASSAAQNAAQTNADAAAAAQNAAKTSFDRQAIQSAIDNLPPGSVPVINNLTTGGISAALSAEQGKVLNTALSNKAEWDGGFLQSGSILAWAEVQTINTHVATNSSVTGFLYETAWSVDFYLYPAGGWRALFATDVQIGVRYYCIKNASQPWTTWIPCATATPPQEYDLPLGEGITTTQHCVYYKTSLMRLA